MGDFLLFIGGVAIIGAIAGSIAIYINDRERRNGKGRSVFLYAFGTLSVGILAGSLFLFLGSPGVCTVFPSETCNLVTTMLGVPIFFAVGIFLFVYFWLNYGKAP